jgi:hypothetical protein
LPHRRLSIRVVLEMPDNMVVKDLVFPRWLKVSTWDDLGFLGKVMCRICHMHYGFVTFYFMIIYIVLFYSAPLGVLM